MLFVSQLIRKYTNSDIEYPVHQPYQGLIDQRQPHCTRTIADHGLGLTGTVSSILHDKKGLMIYLHVADLGLDKEGSKHMTGIMSGVKDCNYLRYGMELNILGYLESKRTGIPVYRLVVVHMWDECKTYDYKYRPEMVEAILNDNADILGQPEGEQEHHQGREITARERAVEEPGADCALESAGDLRAVQCSLF